MMPKPPLNNRMIPPLEAPTLPPPIELPPPTPLTVIGDDEYLTSNETTQILDDNLRRSRRHDPQVLKFIARYMVHRNASQAAEEVGWRPERGAQMRNKSDVYACIQGLTDKLVMKHGYDASEVVERVKEIAFIDPIEFENPDGTYKTHLSQIRPEARRAIKKFKVKNIYGTDPNGMKIVIGELIEVEVWDKLKSLEFLGREKDLFKETKKVEHDVTKRMADTLLGSERLALSTARDVTESGEDE